MASSTWPSWFLSDLAFEQRVMGYSLFYHGKTFRGVLKVAAKKVDQIQ